MVEDSSEVVSAFGDELGLDALSEEERETFGLFQATKFALFERYQNALRSFEKIQRERIEQEGKKNYRGPSITLVANFASELLGAYVEIRPKIVKVKGKKEMKEKYLKDLGALDDFIVGKRSFANSEEFPVLIACFLTLRDFLEDLGITRFDLPTVDRSEAASRGLT